MVKARVGLALRRLLRGWHAVGGRTGRSRGGRRAYHFTKFAHLFREVPVYVRCTMVAICIFVFSGEAFLSARDLLRGEYAGAQ